MYCYIVKVMCVWGGLGRRYFKGTTVFSMHGRRSSPLDGVCGRTLVDFSGFDRGTGFFLSSDLFHHSGSWLVRQTEVQLVNYFSSLPADYLQYCPPY